MYLSQVCHVVRLRCRETGWTPGLKRKRKTLLEEKVKQKNTRNHTWRKTGSWSLKPVTLRDRDKDITPDYRREETGVRHETLTRQEWLRAGEGNQPIKTAETQETRNRAWQYHVKISFNQPMKPRRHYTTSENILLLPGYSTNTRFHEYFTLHDHWSFKNGKHIPSLRCFPTTPKNFSY